MEVLNPNYIQDKRLNKNGCLIKRGFCQNQDYVYDIVNGSKYYSKMPTCQDSKDYFVYCNHSGMRFFTYCEGDLTLVECPTKEKYKKELISQLKYNEIGE